MGWPTTTDDELFGLIDREVERQNTTLQLIASENFTSPVLSCATGSVLTNKYSEGYPGKRYYGGNEVIDEVENLARDWKALFVPSTPTCSRTRVPTPTWPCTSPCWSRATPCSACGSTRAAT